MQGQKIYNASQSKYENVNRVMIVYADDYKEVNSVQSGNIVAVTGLKVCTLSFNIITYCIFQTNILISYTAI